MPHKPVNNPEKGATAIWFWIDQSTVGKRRARKSAVKGSGG